MNEQTLFIRGFLKKAEEMGVPPEVAAAQLQQLAAAEEAAAAGGDENILEQLTPEEIELLAQAVAAHLQANGEKVGMDMSSFDPNAVRDYAGAFLTKAAMHNVGKAQALNLLDIALTNTLLSGK